MIQSTLIDLHPDEYTKGLRYYSFAINLDRCIRKCNTLKNLSHRVCVSNKTKYLNIHVLCFINESTIFNIIQIMQVRI